MVLIMAQVVFKKGKKVIVGGEIGDYDTLTSGKRV